MNKQKKLTLIIGFTIVLITCVIFFIGFIYDAVKPVVDPLDKKLLVPVYFFFILPIILEELSLLRSVHKLINFNPRTFAKICCIISIIIASVALTFHLLAGAGIITDGIFVDSEPGGGAASSRFAALRLFAGWPTFLMSFAFGSANCSKKED